VSTPIGYFEQMYAASRDPWSFESRWYDARKHALTADVLPLRRYRSGFEPGCSTGMLTSRLAAHCDRLLAVDAIEAAVRAAAERVADRPGGGDQLAERRHHARSSTVGAAARSISTCAP